MKRTLLLSVALSGLLGCQPSAPPQAQAPVQPAAQNPAVKEALKTELAGLLERRKTAMDLLNELDEKILKAVDSENETVINSSRELYIPVGEKLIEIQNRINELDKQLGTNSNRKYSPEEKANLNKEFRALIETLQKDVADTKAKLQEEVDKPLNAVNEAHDKMYIKFAELKIELLKQRLEVLN